MENRQTHDEARDQKQRGVKTGGIMSTRSAWRERSPRECGPSLRVANEALDEGVVSQANAHTHRGCEAHGADINALRGRRFGRHNGA